MNDVTIDRKRDCTGCFACAGICKCGAITVSADENGFFKPTVDEALCVGCGLCREVCYSHAESFHGESSLRSYYGWHKDAAVLKNSASGGISSAICEAAMDNGFSVIGCTYDQKAKKAKHIIIEDRKDIAKILGSKYFQSDMSELIPQLLKLDKNRKLVFLGTPCQAQGLKKLFEKLGHNSESLIFVELFCYGVASPAVWKSYIDSPKFKKAENVKFRTKYYGWHVPVNEFTVKGKTVPTKKSGDYFFEAFYSKEFFNRACYACEARKQLGCADLRIGDYWGRRFAADKKGVSCIISASEKGEWLIEKCRNYFDMHDADTEDILAAQSHDKIHELNEKNRNENFTLLREKGLKKSLLNIRRRKPFIQRVKVRIRSFLVNAKSKLKKNAD